MGPPEGLGTHFGTQTYQPHVSWTSVVWAYFLTIPLLPRKLAVNRLTPALQQLCRPSRACIGASLCPGHGVLGYVLPLSCAQLSGKPANSRDGLFGPDTSPFGRGTCPETVPLGCIWVPDRSRRPPAASAIGLEPFFFIARPRQFHTFCGTVAAVDRRVAQWSVRSSRNRKVVGSIPAGSTFLY